MGFNRIAVVLLAVETALLVLSVLLYLKLGLSYAWQSTWTIFGLPIGLLLLWAYLARWPGRSQWDWAVAERILALAVFCIVAAIQPQLQYVALAFNRPLIDGWLIAMDSLMGIRLVEWTEWTRHHRVVLQILVLAYASFGIQLCLPLFALGVRGVEDRAALWEYLFHLTVCVTFTTVAFGWFPSNIPSTLYNFEPVVTQSAVVRHIADVRSGQMTVIDPRTMEGLISFPSFHVAGALIVIWTFRRKRWVIWPLIALNGCLIAATLLLGIHYGIDVVAGALVFLGSAGIYKRFSPGPRIVRYPSGPQASRQRLLQ